MSNRRLEAQSPADLPSAIQQNANLRYASVFPPVPAQPIRIILAFPARYRHT
jgi:hypothetical protein